MQIYKFTNTDAEINKEINYNTIKDKYKSHFAFGLDNLKAQGIYRLMGWAYDFRQELKHYVYKQYGTWQEVYAPNKTLLRKSTYGRIDKILEIK